MKKVHKGVIAGIIIVGAAALFSGIYVFATSNTKANETVSKTQTIGKKHMSYEEPEQGIAVHTIEIEKGGFEPKNVTVEMNETIAFENKDDKDHDVASDVEMFHTDTIKPGDSLETIQFKKPGKYSYHCVLHPEEKGTITVIQ